jgi:ubiquinone/menaquinone biosynthesis C-methylase UbiE
MNITEYNKNAWNNEVKNGNKWTIPVDHETIENAKNGNWKIILTPTKAVPKNWYPNPLKGKEVLCLASGGGQQGPIMAAIGANVTVFDNSPKQLEQDTLVAKRENLNIKTIEGDMRDLSVFEDESFNLIIHPVSNSFIHEIQPVWNEAHRVLRKNGILISGFTNPIVYIFDDDDVDNGKLTVKHSLPYSDLINRTKDEIKKHLENNNALEFSHTLEKQISGQIKAGFSINGFYEDIYSDDLMSKYFPPFIATKAVKL